MKYFFVLLVLSCGVQTPSLKPLEGKKPFFPEYAPYDQGALALLAPEEEKHFEGSFVLFQPNLSPWQIVSMLESAQKVRDLKKETAKFYHAHLKEFQEKDKSIKKIESIIFSDEEKKEIQNQMEEFLEKNVSESEKPFFCEHMLWLSALSPLLGEKKFAKMPIPANICKDFYKIQGRLESDLCQNGRSEYRSCYLQEVKRNQFFRPIKQIDWTQFWQYQDPSFSPGLVEFGIGLDSELYFEDGLKNFFYIEDVEKKEKLESLFFLPESGWSFYQHITYFLPDHHGLYPKKRSLMGTAFRTVENFYFLPSVKTEQLFLTKEQDQEKKKLAKELRELKEHIARRESPEGPYIAEKMKSSQELFKEKMAITALGGGNLSIKKLQTGDQLEINFTLCAGAQKITSTIDLNKQTDEDKFVFFDKKTGQLIYTIPVKEQNLSALSYQRPTEVGFQLIEDQIISKNTVVKVELYPRIIDGILEQRNGKITILSENQSVLYEGSMTFYENFSYAK